MKIPNQSCRKRRSITPSHGDVVPPLLSKRSLLIAAASLTSLPGACSFSLPNPAQHLTAESLVQAQLQHYKTSNLSKIYDLCSPWFQDATGSLEDFEESVKVPPYNLLLGHERADILLETIPDTANKDEDEMRMHAACYLVCIKPGKHTSKQIPVWFWWEVSRHFLEDENGEPIGDEDEGEWRVDCVMPDFDDLDFEAESLAQYLGDGDEDEDDDDDDDDEDGIGFYFDFGF